MKLQQTSWTENGCRQVCTILYSRMYYMLQRGLSIHHHNCNNEIHLKADQIANWHFNLPAVVASVEDESKLCKFHLPYAIIHVDKRCDTNASWHRIVAVKYWSCLQISAAVPTPKPNHLTMTKLLLAPTTGRSVVNNCSLHNLSPSAVPSLIIINHTINVNQCKHFGASLSSLLLRNEAMPYMCIHNYLVLIPFATLLWFPLQSWK